MTLAQDPEVHDLHPDLGRVLGIGDQPEGLEEDLTMDELEEGRVGVHEGNEVTEVEVDRDPGEDRRRGQGQEG